MKNLIKLLFLSSLLAFSLSSCDTDVEALQLQKPKEYSEEYYKNLRAYKESDHAISFGWFADYTGGISMGHSFLGLPDSLDICSLWGGIPSGEALENMRFVQRVKGTKFVMVLFPGVSGIDWVMALPEDQRVTAFGDTLLANMKKHQLDGIDLDNEIHGDWMYGANLVKLIEHLGKSIGPKSPNPEKLLIVDGWPTGGGYEYMSFFVSQAYQTRSARNLQWRYEEVADFVPPERFVVTENMGDYFANGGVPFTDADGKNESVLGGQLYSLEGMARWNPTQGRKGGFGAFFMQRDYNNTPAYKYFRLGIQLQNPAK